jgi:hypothetical protein
MFETDEKLKGDLRLYWFEVRRDLDVETLTRPTHH